MLLGFFRFFSHAYRAIGVCAFFSVGVLVPLSVRAQSGPPRFEAGAVFQYAHQPDVEEVNIFTLGGRFDWNLRRHLGLEAELTHSPFVTTNGGRYSGGHLTQVLFGIKYGTRWQHMGMFFKARPGFNRYSSAATSYAGVQSPPVPVGGPLTIPALNLGGSIEFYLSHHWMISNDGGLTINWYPQRTAPLISPGSTANVVIPGNTTATFQYSTAISYRFGREAYPQAQVETGGPSHPFWDRENDLLFAGIGVARALDFASTLNKRSRGLNEGFLNDAVVDNHAEFAAIEIAGAATSIGVSYLFHRYGHHRIERGVSMVHIGATLIGAAVNYSTRACLAAQKDASGNCP